jgi:hypothetical protein
VRNGSIIPIPINVDEASSFARLVSELTEDEIIFLSTLLNVTNELGLTPENIEESAVFKETTARLVPNFFRNPKDCFFVASGLQRTGFVHIPQTWGGFTFDSTPKLLRLARVCDFDGISVN